MKDLLQALSVSLVIAASAALALGQGARKAAAFNPLRVQQPDTVPQTSADETFDLNISERHIIKSNYMASTAVEAKSEAAQGLTLRVGVAVRAGTIDVLLRNVAAHVRFRASLDPVLARIRSHQATGPTR